MLASKGMGKRAMSVTKVTFLDPIAEQDFKVVELVTKKK